MKPRFDISQKSMIKELTKGQIRESAIQELTLRGVHCWKQNNLAVRGRKFIGEEGLPDIIGFVKSTGQFVGCEVKTVGDRLSDGQKGFLLRLSVAGGVALIAKQSDAGAVILEPFEKNEA